MAELMGVSPGHVREVLAGRKPGYGVLCLLVEYATENRAAGRQRVVRSAARRAEQVEELRLDFMAAGCDRGAMVQAAGSACSELRRDESRLYEGGGSLPAQDVTDGVIDFNGMEG